MNHIHNLDDKLTLLLYIKEVYDNIGSEKHIKPKNAKINSIFICLLITKEILYKKKKIGL
jgi:hypothetical protein